MFNPATLLLAFAALAQARVAPPRPAPPIPAADIVGPVTSPNGTSLPPYTTIYLFDQLIDHTNPSKGTFKQRYYFTAEWYETDGPIVLMTPGEIAFDAYSRYLTNATIVGSFAQATHGATVILEHRFYGQSNPGPDLSAASLAVHTLDQAMDDLIYFTKNSKLPMPNGDKVTPDKAAWVLMGGSYSGALTAWTMNNRPGTFWAGYASSAVVETINYLWGYFEPIRQHMPQNCSADVEAVITHVDQVLSKGSASDIAAIKANFGLSDLTHVDDVAGALRNNLWDWQSLSPDVGPGALFFQFCDALEVKNGVSANASGWGLSNALPAWGNFFKNSYLSRLCGSTSIADCLGTYDTSLSIWSNTSLGQDSRSWEWIVCNQVGYLQDGAPTGWPSLVTRLVTPIYDERQCEQFWPDHFTSPPVPKTAATNKELQGWDLNVDRLFFANGKRDPWRECTVSSDYHPRQSTSEQVIAVSDGFHCSDLITANANVDSSVKDVFDLGIAYLGKWLQQWRAQHPHVSGASNFTTADPATLPNPPPFVPLPIPQSIVNAPPPPLPSTITGKAAPPQSSHRAVAGHIIPNAWFKHF